MKIAFFHGLESAPRSEKNTLLEKLFGAENVYAPAMDYKKPELFQEVLRHLQENPVDLLVGSSMGGYFAHLLSTCTGTRALLFNPALHSRPFEPAVESGAYVPGTVVILGTNDTVVEPEGTMRILYGEKKNFEALVTFEEMEHRIPLAIFEKHLIKEKQTTSL